MGGSPNLLLPVGSRRMSSWADHQERRPKSREPGTDFFCPIGTPVRAPESGRIYDFGNSIEPDTGRWIGIEFDNGLSGRGMHFSKLLRTRGRVDRGDIIALSGASGYGEEDWSWNVSGTGGAHVHWTLWPSYVRRFGYDWRGRPFTVDMMNYVGGFQGGNESPAEVPRIIPFYERPYGRSEEHEMLCVQIVDGLGALGPKGKTRTYTVGPGLFLDTTGEAGANLASVIINGYDEKGVVRATPNLSYKGLYDWARQALSGAELAPYARAAGVAVS